MRRAHPIPQVLAPAPSDVELVRAIRHREPDALATLYDRHASMLFGVAVRILRDAGAAEEAVLDAFVQLWEQADRYDSTRAAPRAWLSVLVRSRALDAVRARRTRTRWIVLFGDSRSLAAVDQGHAAEDGPLDWTVQRERAQELHAALARLDASQREAVELSFLQGLTHPEIAARLSLPLGTVKTRIRTGLRRMRETLSAHPPGGLRRSELAATWPDVSHRPDLS